MIGSSFLLRNALTASTPTDDILNASDRVVQLVLRHFPKIEVKHKSAFKIPRVKNDFLIPR